MRSLCTYAASDTQICDPQLQGGLALAMPGAAIAARLLRRYPINQVWLPNSGSQSVGGSANQAHQVPGCTHLGTDFVQSSWASLPDCPRQSGSRLLWLCSLNSSCCSQLAHSRINIWFVDTFRLEFVQLSKFVHWYLWLLCKHKDIVNVVNTMS